MTTTDIILPEPITETVAIELPASDVMPGDAVHLTGGRPTIATTKPGRTKMSAFDETGRRVLYADLTDLVIVTRTRETDESKTARRNAYHNARILERANEDIQNARDVAEKVAGYVASGVASGFDYAELMEAQQSARIARELLHIIDMHPELSALEARQLLIDEYTKQLLSETSTRGLSRSSSVMHNVLDDAWGAARVNFIRHSRYFA